MRMDAKQLTLGLLITLLERVERPDAEVYFDFCDFMPTGHIASYRGYYEDLALGWNRDRMPYSWNKAKPDQEIKVITAEALLKVLREARGEVFTGYKGGDYTASDETAIWVANNGETGGTALVNVKDGGWQVILETKHID